MPLNKFLAKLGIRTTTTTGNTYFSSVPPGVVIMHSSPTAPEGWLLCDGTAYTKTLYPDLNAVLSVAGYPFGSASLTFNVPNLNGNMPIGAGAGSGLTTRSLGAVGGANTAAIGEPNLPGHQHGTNNHTHASSTVNSAGAHYHGLSAVTSGGYSADHTHTLQSHSHSWYYSAIRNTGTTQIAIRSAGTTRTGGISGGTETTGTQGPLHSHPGTVSGASGNQSANHKHDLTTNNNNATNTGGTFAPTAVSVANPKIGVCFIIKI